MARYDRIALIDPPPREAAFPGWLTLRDLDGQERDADLGRRARLRFLALRPVRRILDRGDRIEAGSIARQTARVRAELEQLPADDPDRVRIAGFLDAVDGGAMDRTTDAAIAMGAAAWSAGHEFAAEEYFLTALELAERHDMTAQRIWALRSLGRLYAVRGDRAASIDRLETAIEAGRDALDRFPEDGETRDRVLLAMGAAFRSLALRPAAEACYQIVERRTGSPAARREARQEHAMTAAENGDRNGFRARRQRLLDEPAEEPEAIATLHLALGQGALLVDEIDDARSHLADAIRAAQAGGLGDALAAAEGMLSSLEDRADRALRDPPATPSDGARTIAQWIEAMERELVASGE